MECGDVRLLRTIRNERFHGARARCPHQGDNAVKLAAAEALDRFPTVHGLVLSAVAHVQGGPIVLRSGHELMFATNVMGPFSVHSAAGREDAAVKRLGSSCGCTVPQRTRLEGP